MEAGLEVLQRIREEVGVPVLTDVHDVSQVERVAEVVDVLQIPAFLCRQTDLLTAAALAGIIMVGAVVTYRSVRVKGRLRDRLVLTGLRGVGKTVLLNQLRSAAISRGWGTGSPPAPATNARTVVPGTSRRRLDTASSSAR